MAEIIKHKQHKGAVLPIVFIIAGIAVLTVIIVWLLLWTRPQPQATLEQLAPVKVMLTEVSTRRVRPYESVTGRLQPVKTAQIRFEVAGKVVSRHVEPGTRVVAGEVLMKLDPADYQDQLQQAAAELTIEKKSVGRDKELLSFARNNLQLQQHEEQRMQRLLARSLIAQSQLDSIRQRVFDLQAELARLEYSVATNNARIKMKQAQYEIAQRNHARTTLIAAFDGVVNEIFINEGDYVSANEVALVLVDTSELDVQVDVRGEMVAQLELGQQVDVQSNEMALQGEVIALQHDPDINTNTHQIRVRVASEKVQSGMLANVKLPLAVHSESVLIPVAAVLNQFGKSYVYTVTDGRLTKHAVQLGRRIDNEIIVHTGLSVGQKIVARDVGSLNDQQQVVTE